MLLKSIGIQRRRARDLAKAKRRRELLILFGTAGWIRTTDLLIHSQPRHHFTNSQIDARDITFLQ